MLAKAGADLNSINDHCFNALYLAILNVNEDCAEYLLEEGALSYINGTDIEKDRSPIFLAIRLQNTKLLESMCDYHNDLTLKNSEGLTPLMYAAKHGYN